MSELKFPDKVKTSVQTNYSTEPILKLDNLIQGCKSIFLAGNLFRKSDVEDFYISRDIDEVLDNESGLETELEHEAPVIKCSTQNCLSTSETLQVSKMTKHIKCLNDMEWKCPKIELLEVGDSPTHQKGPQTNNMDIHKGSCLSNISVQALNINEERSTEGPLHYDNILPQARDLDYEIHEMVCSDILKTEVTDIDDEEHIHGAAYHLNLLPQLTGIANEEKGIHEAVCCNNVITEATGIDEKKDIIHSAAYNYSIPTEVTDIGKEKGIYRASHHESSLVELTDILFKEMNSVEAKDIDRALCHSSMSEDQDTNISEENDINKATHNNSLLPHGSDFVNQQDVHRLSQHDGVQIQEKNVDQTTMEGSLLTQELDDDEVKGFHAGAWQDCTVSKGTDINEEKNVPTTDLSGHLLDQEMDIDIIKDIHEAVRRGSIIDVMHFLDGGADPDEPDWLGNGDPPILQAAVRQNISIIKALCDAGCDVNASSVRGETALHAVVSSRPINKILLETLLTAGCDPNIQDKLKGQSPLHCVATIFDDESEVFHRLAAVSNVNLQDHRHSTVLHRIAATTTNPLRLQQVLDLGANPSIQNDRGETALCVALEHDWVEGAVTLIHRGTDLRCATLYHETAMHIASRKNKPVVVAALLDCGAEVNTCDLAGNTALHLAAGRGFSQVVRLLLTPADTDLNAQNKNGATPLHIAVESGFIDVVEILMQAEQIDLKAETALALTALDLAGQGYRRRSQPEMFQVLTRELEKRQDPHLT